MAKRIKAPPRIDPFIDVWTQLDRHLCALILSDSPEIRHAARQWQDSIGKVLLKRNEKEARTKIIDLEPAQRGPVFKGVWH